MRGHDPGGNEVGSDGILLADHPSPDPADRSILDARESLDLTALADAATIRFGIQSSQNDPTYGVDSPAYFAANNFVVPTHPMRSLAGPAGDRRGQGRDSRPTSDREERCG